MITNWFFKDGDITNLGLTVMFIVEIGCFVAGLYIAIHFVGKYW